MKGYGLFFLSGLLIGIGLMVFDEILTFAIYAGPHGCYPIPLLGCFSLYEAEEFSWLLILSGVLSSLAVFLRKLDRGTD
jgi:hypothetical protein